MKADWQSCLDNKVGFKVSLLIHMIENLIFKHSDSAFVFLLNVSNQFLQLCISECAEALIHSRDEDCYICSSKRHFLFIALVGLLWKMHSCENF